MSSPKHLAARASVKRSYYPLKLSIDCASVTHNFLFIVTSHWKNPLIVHPWHVIPSSLLGSIGKICCLSIFQRKITDCAFLACDYFFMVKVSPPDKLTVLFSAWISRHRYVSSERSFTVHFWHIISSSLLNFVNKIM